MPGQLPAQLTPRPGPWARGPLPGGVDVEGHRGARGLAPESCWPSFATAIDAGVTGVELDVRLTSDGHVVVWHDPTLQPEKCVFTDVDYSGARVADLTLDQLRTVDVGARTLDDFPQQVAAPRSGILTLAELFERGNEAAPQLWWTVEVKVDPGDPSEVASRAQLVEGTIEAIRSGGVGEHSFVHSFDWAVLELARGLDPQLPRSALAVVGGTYAPGSDWLGSLRYDDFGDDLAAAAQALGAVVVAPHFSSCTAGFVDRAHELGVSVLPWTVNEESDIRAVVDAGVDGFVTDYPDRGRAVADER